MSLLQRNIFSKDTAYVGLVGLSFLLLFDVCASFVSTFGNVTMIFAMIGGLLTMA